MHTVKDFEEFLTRVRSETGVEALEADEAGLASMRVDDKFNLNLQFVEPSDKILCFVEVTELPGYAPSSIYRELLAAGLFGAETAGGYFALEKESSTVVYNYLFDFDKAAADPAAFAETLENILTLCEDWQGRISAGLVADDVPVSSHEAILV